MTMHLLPAYFTSTNLRVRQPKPKQLSAHDAWLWKRGLHPEQIRLKKSGNKNWKREYSESLQVDRTNYVSAGFGNGNTAKSEPKVYNGERKLIGIATMHKSNMVPVFAKSDAEDIARMRRG